MHVRRLPIALLSLVAVVAGGLSTALSTIAVEAAPRPKLFVEVADTSTLSPDGQTATIEVTASCPRAWQVLEAFVTISQPQTFGMGGIPLSCTGRAQSFVVTVPSQDAAFQPGPAQASAFVLIERGDRTRQAQDSETIQLM